MSYRQYSIGTCIVFGTYITILSVNIMTYLLYSVIIYMFMFVMCCGLHT